MAKNLDIILLLDVYGSLLTDKQRDFISYYYDEDLSLAEIAENSGISRQGVRDAIKRAETQLLDLEDKLGILRKSKALNNSLNGIISYADTIYNENLNGALSPVINDMTVRIRSLCEDLINE
ncbi:MAG: YlxM family DNA-binding protein [Clostridia bacterium]|nr:YlxM family DNA-binding protein [Clostridia bacterium]